MKEKIMIESNTKYDHMAKKIPQTLNAAAYREECIVENIPNVWSRLDELDISLNDLKDQLDNLHGRLIGLMSIPQDYPVPGPRSYNSDITGRICQQLDFTDDLCRKVNDIRDRLTV